MLSAWPAWAAAKTEIFAGKQTQPDTENPEIVNYMIWYETTGYTRPYPGETSVRMPSDFKTTVTLSHDIDDFKATAKTSVVHARERD